MKSFREFIFESNYGYSDNGAYVRGVMAAKSQAEQAKHPVRNAEEIAGRTRRLKFGGMKDNQLGLSLALRDAQEHDKRFSTGGKLERHVKELMVGDATSKFPYGEEDEKKWNHHQAMEHLGNLKEHPTYKKLFSNPTEIHHGEHAGTTRTEVVTPTHTLEMYHSGSRDKNGIALHTVRLWKHANGTKQLLGQAVKNATPYEVGNLAFKGL